MYNLSCILAESIGGMDKKNTSNTEDSHNKRPSGSRLLDIATSAAILAILFSSTPDYAQTSSYPLDAHKKNTLELVGNNSNVQHQKNIKENTGKLESAQKDNTIDHQKIIKENLKDILSKYGQEK